MCIRPAVSGDAPALARVIIDSGRAAHRGQVPDEVLLAPPLDQAYAESERNWRRTLQELDECRDPDECVFVAEDESGVVVGLAMGGPARDAAHATGEVYVLYVLPAYQGRGLGQRLVQAVAAHLAAHGMPALQIACLAANTPARRFYEARGGRVVMERLFDHDGILVPEVVYGWDDVQRLAAGDIPRVASGDSPAVPALALRAVRDADLPALFEHQRDPEANRVAAFPARDWEAFVAHWAKIRADTTNITQAIIIDGQVAGTIGSWVQDGEREVGYWIGRVFWGRGIATAALAAFLHLVTERPLHARVAAHNGASLRVLEKCGFRVVRTDHDPAGDGVDEIALMRGAGARSES